MRTVAEPLAGDLNGDLPADDDAKATESSGRVSLNST